MKDYRDFIEYVNEHRRFNTVAEIKRDFDDIVQYFVDGQIDIYYYNLRKWIQENPDADIYMERVIQEGMIDSSGYDFYNHVQYAQWLYISENNVCTFDEWLQTLKDNCKVTGVYSLSNCGGIEILESYLECEVVYIDAGVVEYSEVHIDDDCNYYFEYGDLNIYFNDIMRV